MVMRSATNARDNAVELKDMRVGEFSAHVDSPSAPELIIPYQSLV
jgi:hypothetical protein